MKMENKSKDKDVCKKQGKGGKEAENQQKISGLTKKGR